MIGATIGEMPSFNVKNLAGTLIPIVSAVLVLGCEGNIEQYDSSNEEMAAGSEKGNSIDAQNAELVGYTGCKEYYAEYGKCVVEAGEDRAAAVGSCPFDIKARCQPSLLPWEEEKETEAALCGHKILHDKFARSACNTHEVTQLTMDKLGEDYCKEYSGTISLRQPGQGNAVADYFLDKNWLVPSEENGSMIFSYTQTLCFVGDELVAASEPKFVDTGKTIAD